MAKKRAKKNPFKVEDFKYLDNIGYTLPQLVVGVKISPSCFAESDWPCRQYDFKLERKWLKIAHQTAGLACHQHYMVGTILRPKSVDLLQNMQRLSDKWLDSNAGLFGLSLSEANDYSSDIKYLLEVGCNGSWGDMEEAIYPIDCTTENLKKMTSDDLPENLDELVNWQSGWERGIGCVNRWSLFVLGPNSD